MSPPPRPDALPRLLRECLVQVDPDPDDGTRGGSGFFVAPDYVLTCAHVVPSQTGPPGARTPVEGTWAKGGWSGQVVFASPPPPGGDQPSDVWPYPDIAVIQVITLTGESLTHSCVRLARYRLMDDTPDDPVEGRTDMYAAGRYAPLGGKPGDYPSVSLSYAGPHGPLLRLAGDTFEPGMSGGPVLDRRTGKVCAMLKSIGDDNAGYAVPVGDLYSMLPPDLAAGILREHDIYHHQQRRWTQAQEPLWHADAPAASLLRPSEEAELLGMTAELTDRTDVLGDLWHLFDEATVSAESPLSRAPKPDALRDLQDLVLALCEATHMPGLPHPVVAFTAVLAGKLAGTDASVSSALWGWANGTAGRLGMWDVLLEWHKRHRESAPGTAGSVIIKLDPANGESARRPKYAITVWRYRDNRNGRRTLPDIPPCTLPDAVRILMRSITSAVGQLGGPPVLIELVLPRTLFDAPGPLRTLFQEPFQPTGSAEPGAVCPVVIRDLERFGSPAYRAQGGRWWDWLAAQPGIALNWHDCIGHAVDDNPAAPPGTSHQPCLGMALPASGGAGSAILDPRLRAHLPVAVWRGIPCDRHDPQVRPGPGGAATPDRPCPGQQFRTRVAPTVSATALYELPMATTKIRNGNARVTHDVLLLWDNPHRGPSPSRLQLSSS